MKKYLIFAWHSYDASGDVNYVRFLVDTLPQAIRKVKKLKNEKFPYDNIEIIDRDTLEILRDE